MNELSKVECVETVWAKKQGDVLNKTKKVLRSSDVEKNQTIFPEFNISFKMFYRKLWNGVAFEGVPGTTWL